MILPYAATDTFSFFTLLILFSLIVIGFGIIIYLNISFIKNQKTTFEKMNSDNLKLISELKERVDALGLMFSKTMDNLNEFKSTKASHDNLIKDMKSEITRIADGISGQDIMTKAIELARSDANVEQIMSSTGLSKSDAEAIIKFHKN